MLIHTGKKPYESQLCQKKFRRKHHFERHTFTQHESHGIAVELFNCAVCRKGFKLKDRLEQHMFMHTKDKP